MIKIKRASIPLIALLLVSISPVSEANAHSVLLDATPKKGEQLEEPINSVVLTFSTKVENGSTLYLINKKGKKIQPVSVETTDDILKATFQDSLKSGSYQVNWKVVGADGHLIEKQYSFSIVEPEKKKSEESTTQLEDDQDTTSNNNKKDDETEQNNQDEVQKESSPNNQTKSDSDQSFLGNGIIIFLIIVGLLLVGWMLFSKRGK